MHVLSISFEASGVSTVAYRLGLDILEDAPEVPSALAPENSEADTAGWHRLDPAKFSWQTVPCNIRESILSGNSQATLEASSVNRRGAELAELQTGMSTDFGLVSSPAGETMLHTMVAISQFQSMKFFRLKGDRFEPLPGSLTGNAEHMVMFELTVAALAVAVLILSHVILLAGGDLVDQTRWKTDRYSFGHDFVVLAPLTRRWLARGIDLAVVLTPLFLFAAWSVSGIKAETFTVPGRGHRLGMRDHVLRYPLIRNNPGLYAACLWAVACPLAFVVMQARWGCSLGKWICGLRVVRTTLRPCGFVRSLLREVLLGVDTLFLLTGFPVSWRSGAPKIEATPG